jgi:trigger factor
MSQAPSQTDAPAGPANTVTVEDAGPCLKKLKITIPGERVAGQLETSLDLVAAEAQLPGFRPGRAPRRLIEKKFGSAVRDEAKQQLLSGAFQEAVQEHELNVISDPTAEGVRDIEVEPGKEIEVEFEVEVAPEFELPDFSKIEVKKPKFEVTDERIEEQLDRVRLNEGDLEPQDASERGDYCIGRGVLKTEEGETVLDLPGAVIQVPKDEDKGQILGVVVDDMYKQVGTPKPGDTLTVKATGPEQHEREEIRGKPIEITFDVEQVQRIIPADDEKLVARYGFADAEQLRQSIRAQLERRVAAEQQQAMREQAARQLLDDLEFELPERLTAAQAERNLTRRRMELEYEGADPAEIENQIAEMRGASDERARRDLKLFFILNSIASKLDIGVTEDEVNGRIAQIAAERGERPDRLRSQLIDSGRVQMLATQIREHKALDAVVDQAKVEEIDAEDYKKMVDERDTQDAE